MAEQAWYEVNKQPGAAFADARLYIPYTIAYSDGYLVAHRRSEVPRSQPISDALLPQMAGKISDDVLQAVLVQAAVTALGMAMLYIDVGSILAAGARADQLLDYSNSNPGYLQYLAQNEARTQLLRKLGENLVGPTSDPSEVTKRQEALLRFYERGDKIERHDQKQWTARGCEPGSEIDWIRPR